MLAAISRMFRVRAACQRRSLSSQLYSHQIVACEERLLLSAVDVTTSPGPGGSVKVTFNGTDGDDQVLLGPHFETGLLTAYNFNGTTYRLNGGPEVSEIVFNTSISDVTFNLASGADSVSVFTTSIRDLNLNLGSGNDIAFVVDANVRDVTIQDGVTDDEQNSYNFQTFASSFQVRNIEAEFDRGSSSIVVNAFTGQTIQLGKVEISGENVQSVNWALAYDTSSHVLVNGKVDIEINPASFGVANVSLGSLSSAPGETGSVELSKSISVSAPGASLNVSGNTTIHGKTDFVTTGFINDRFEVSSGAAVFEGAVTISMGDGDDVVLLEKFDPSLPATEFHGKVDISTGAGNDIVNIGPANFAKSLSIDLGSSVPFGPFGVDNLRLGIVDVAGTLDVSSTGEATVVINPAAGGQAHFHKDATFTLGAGRIFVSSTDSNVNFDKWQTFIGQPDRIQVFYIGNVVANPAKRKLINADFFAS